MRGSWRRGAACAMGSLVCVAFLAVAGSAAADPWSDPSKPGNWSGLYIGAHGGYGLSDLDYTLTIPGLPTDHMSQDAGGGIYGGHLGVQHQYGRLVAGLEVSYSELDLSDTAPSQAIANRSRTVDINSLFTATARLGLATDHTLLYVKGGYAAADLDTSVFITGSPVKSTVSGWDSGLIFGAGIEFKCLSRFILGLEYDFVSLDVDGRSGVLPDTKPFTYTDFETDTHSFLARISYQFGSDPAPAPLK